MFPETEYFTVSVHVVSVIVSHHNEYFMSLMTETFRYYSGFLKSITDI